MGSVSNVAHPTICVSQPPRNCTYTFSPTSGLILLHTIDSIEPTPHQALFEALGRFGLVGRGGGDLPGVGGAR